jgi:hypothetical protein
LTVGASNADEHGALNYMRRLAKIVSLALAAVILTPLALVALYVATIEFLIYFQYANRPILAAMRSAPGPITYVGWVGDSYPAKEAFLRKLPRGSSASDVTAALTAEGFKCGIDTSSPVCGLTTREFIVTLNWSVRLKFDERDRLEDVTVNLSSFGSL